VLQTQIAFEFNANSIIGQLTNDRVSIEFKYNLQPPSLVSNLTFQGTYLANVAAAWNSPNNNDVEDVIKTLITYDNGKTWSTLQAPEYDSNGVPLNCTGSCSLNLFGQTTWLGETYGPFYTAPQAVGLILATGNV
jgi:hypothetical protein